MISEEIRKAAAAEYHASRDTRRNPQKEDPIVKEAFEGGSRPEQIGTWMGEATQVLLAAQIAYGVGDKDLTHRCIARLSSLVRMLITSWNEERRKQRQDAARQTGGEEPKEAA